MKIIIPIKQVPETSNVKMDEEIRNLKKNFEKKYLTLFIIYDSLK